jgi:DNA-binding XRE family transcriptional regulator
MNTRIEEDAECPPEAEAKAVAARLEKVREDLGLFQREIAKLIGVTEGNWSDFENGKRRISLNAAISLIKRVDGVTLDWIYFGIGRPPKARMRLPKARRAATIAEAVKAEQPKRKLGRPPGSKNKPKSKPAINGDPYRFL